MVPSAPRMTVLGDILPHLDPMDSGRSHGMEGLTAFLVEVRDRGLARNRLRGLFHLAIGRRILKSDGTVVSTGVTWRELAILLKDLKFDKDLAAQITTELEELSPRDRQRFWYSVIAISRPDGLEARTEADTLAMLVKPLGYLVAPNTSGPPTPEPAPKKVEHPKPRSKKK